MLVPLYAGTIASPICTRLEEPCAAQAPSNASASRMVPMCVISSDLGSNNKLSTQRDSYLYLWGLDSAVAAGMGPKW
jgi:hypothetical protein